MSIRVALHHRTAYTYDRSVQLSPQVVRLRPAPHCRTPVTAYSLQVEPKPHFLNWQQDPYGNWLARLVFPKMTRSFEVTVDLVAEMTAINPFDFFVEEAAEKFPFQYDPLLAHELAPYLAVPPATPLLAKLVDEVRSEAPAKEDGERTIDFVVRVNHRLNGMVKYLIRLEPGVQSPEETLEKASGSCRDSAWLLVHLFRHLGVAARFCSGYLIQLVHDEKPIDGPAGTSADFTDLHAWAEVYLPGAGWVGLDPTSGLLAGEGHLPLACTAEPMTAAPVSGSFTFDAQDEDEKVETEFEFAMSVTRVSETPRVTKPYTDEQWSAADSLGRRIDAELRRNDVRLTMGGEPTFVSSENRDAEEWNTAAHGPRKRRSAGTLVRRLRDRWAPTGLLHFGEGKWYPGESLPRWALGLYWRRDGQPVWREPTLVADDDTDYRVGPNDAQRFVSTLAGRLGVTDEQVLPGYEDAWYWMWKERRLPANVDPLQNRLEEAEERERMARVFERGLKTPVGFALPVRREGGVWQTGKWFLRQEHLFLTPGDSPMGLRLPLDSLPWQSASDRDPLWERDAFEPRGPLPPPRYGLDRRLQRFGGPVEFGQVAPGKSQPGVVRTALCVEPRHGRLMVFLPPQRSAEDFLDLVGAIEETAATLGLPVQVEGYTPPFDPRLNSLKVTPDPGVIEVNLHPSHSWGELVAHTEGLYEEARQTKLVADKFLHDGRQVGTGGGNHVILGGPTPADSPVLRRPDLLRSLLAYWQNHPSLSFLFSSLFIGPTSQAPRVDEARNDALYELELAFRQVPQGQYTPPWLVDRVFRHLLADSAGNTHRTEFCIDKLYSPDTATGRLGLVELRSFEMPPHARMSLVQQLLLRGMVARFWKEPYERPLVRWGTELHDRFMLPHFVMTDFADVLEDMREAGYPFRDDWFAPHAEFRFPLVGTVAHRGVELELRHALEPWHVLGEEPAGGGTTRFVDSSVERLQVRVRGMTDPRHVVTVNGRRLPLHPTGTNGEHVAGVRFRAWQPPACLHPTVGVQSPLTFDVLDTWTGRSAGGCTYYVAHPGGRSFETAPINAEEASGRRQARFWAFGHTPGVMTATVPAEERRPECPLTLDLRQPPPAVPATGMDRGGAVGRMGVASANGTSARPAGV